LRGKKTIRCQLSRGFENHRNIALNHSKRCTVKHSERIEKNRHYCPLRPAPKEGEAMTIPVPAETPDPNIDDPELPVPKPEEPPPPTMPPVIEPPKGDPPSQEPPAVLDEKFPE
jgi:hypothetical protein